MNSISELVQQAYENGKKNGYVQAKTEEIINRLEDTTREWISVHNQLPQYNQSVLVYCPERHNIYCAYIDRVDGRDEWYIFGAFDKMVDETVTCWMPLPDAPYKRR